jgi:hypothetical protein
MAAVIGIALTAIFLGTPKGKVGLTLKGFLVKREVS